MEMKILQLLTSEKLKECKRKIFKLNIPLAQFLSKINEIPKDKLLCCIVIVEKEVVH